MDKYLKRGLDSPFQTGKNYDITKSSKEEFNPNTLETDPGKRIPISDYHPNLQDDVRRAYMLKGPCQPKLVKFPPTKFGDRERRFNHAWYHQYANWLEYSVAKDAAYCLCCYLFKQNNGDQGGWRLFCWRRIHKLEKRRDWIYM